MAISRERLKRHLHLADDALIVVCRWTPSGDRVVPYSQGIPNEIRDSRLERRDKSAEIRNSSLVFELRGPPRSGIVS